MKRKKGPTYIGVWVSKGNDSSLTMQQPLGYEVHTGECLDIATMGSTTIKADQVASQWAYYTSGEGSSSSKSKKQAAAAPTSQQQQLIQQQQPKGQRPATGGTTGGKQTRHYTPQIAATASTARQREHASMVFLAHLVACATQSNSPVQRPRGVGGLRPTSSGKDQI